MERKEIAEGLGILAAEVEEVNIKNGWYDGLAARTFGEDVALLHSEVSEALEAWRDYGLDEFPMCRVGPMAEWAPCTAEGCKRERKVLGVGSEMADIFIRLLDTCNRRGIDLFAEYERKAAYNRTRPYRHGGKAL